MTSPLYLIPGTMCDDQLWEQLRPELAEVSPELETRHLPIPPGDSVPELVEKLASALPTQPVDLFGFSLGGYLAAALACRYPQRVRRLFLCANSPCALPEEETRQRHQLLKWVGRHGYSGISDRKIAAMLGAANRGRADIAATMRAMDARLGQDSLLSRLQATSARDDLGEELVALSALPLTFCFGEDDRLVTRGWVEALRQRRPDIVVSEIPSAGHMLPLEQPVALAAEINRWLAR